MRIIDKQHDFYDYLQDSTGIIVFDRRGSFLLRKEDICLSLSLSLYRRSKYRFLLLQCGGTFWLFLVTVTEKTDIGSVKSYDIEELVSWKNYNKPNALFKLDVITVSSHGLSKHIYGDYDVDLIRKHVANIKEDINQNNFRIEYNISDYKSNTESKRLPLFKACGIGNSVDPTQMFCAIEEYFSIEKTKAEKTVAEGTTNNDKITMHGFDIKESFRGKR